VLMDIEDDAVGMDPEPPDDAASHLGSREMHARTKRPGPVRSRACPPTSTAAPTAPVASSYRW